ncbi:MAG: hypothetical protein WAM79_24080 [Candidatus Sulfotelmatobacter sp.]
MRASAAEAGTVHVGTAAIGCPGGPEVSVRSAPATHPIPAHDFKTPPQILQTQGKRKPPAPAPKGRKNAAHAVRHG